MRRMRLVLIVNLEIRLIRKREASEAGRVFIVLLVTYEPVNSN